MTLLQARMVRPHPARGQRTPMTPRGTLGHSIHPATAVQSSHISGAQPRLPRFSLQSTVPASCTQGQGHVSLNQGWKLEAARSQRPLTGCYIFPCCWHLRGPTWGDAESAPGWARAARAQQLALGWASQACLLPAPEAPQLGTGIPSSLPLPSSFLALGEEAPPTCPRGAGAAEAGTESKPSPQPSSPALGQSSRTLFSLEPRTSPAAIPADSLGSSCGGRGGPRSSHPTNSESQSSKNWGATFQSHTLPRSRGNGLADGPATVVHLPPPPQPSGVSPPPLRPPPPLAVEVRHLLALFFPAGRQARALVSGASVPINRPSISHVDPL